jgi:hypothetical protein
MKDLTSIPGIVLIDIKFWSIDVVIYFFNEHTLWRVNYIVWQLVIAVQKWLDCSEIAIWWS